MKYTILTSRSVMDIPYENAEQNERETQALWEEQNRIIKELAPSEFYKAHFLNSRFFDEHIRKGTLDDLIQCLAIKDGCDLVRFENGKLGYVAYYNGHENGFEFEPISRTEYYKEEE